MVYQGRLTETPTVQTELSGQLTERDRALERLRAINPRPQVRTKSRP